MYVYGLRTLVCFAGINLTALSRTCVVINTIGHHKISNTMVCEEEERALTSK